MKYLTERQRDILNFIREYQSANGVSPTHREICDHFGFSSFGTVYKHLSLLQQKGLIQKDWNQKRGVVVVDDPQPMRDAVGQENLIRELPLLGYIAAGRPLDIVASEETIPVPQQLTSRGENFVLKVRGDSMIDDGIHDGDFVIISRRATAENGQMVVAMISGEVTLKRFYGEGQRIRLQPANSSMVPLIVPRDSVTVQGVVVGLMRRF